MQNTYTKVFTLKGYYFAKEYKKTIKGKPAVRGILEETVRKQFKAGNCDIEVFFEETGRQVLLTKDSSDEDIKKYLGDKFLKK